MYCMKCGKEIPEQSKVCGYCGHRLPAPPPPQAPARVKPAKRSRPMQDARPAVAEPQAEAPPAPIKKTKRAPRRTVRRRSSAPRSLPWWGWVAIAAGALALVVLILLISLRASTRQIYLADRCQQSYSAHADERIDLHYGYWGVIGDDWIRKNDNALSLRLYIDGTLHEGRRARLLRSDELPCPASGDFSASFLDEARWLHDMISISFEPGQYDIQVIWYLTERISDGYDYDGDGLLDMYGPGEVSRREFTILVTQ